MLYLVPKTASSHQPKGYSQSTENQPNSENLYKQRFLSNFQEISSKLFAFYAQDARYDLRCSLLLDTQNMLICDDNTHDSEEHLIPMVICDFPAIDSLLLHEKAFENEYIQGILMTRFYLNILESLFLFCKAINANGLFFTVGDYNPQVIETYQPFVSCESQISSVKGEQTQIMISTDNEAYHALTDYIEKVNQDFRHTLWRKQWGNPTLREYLKSYALSDF
jgi:hypothetical protein